MQQQMKWSATLLLMFTSSLASAQLAMVGFVSGGNGCPLGSVQVIMAPDGSTFSVLYDHLTAQVGQGTPLAIIDCEVQIKINKPKMFGFSIESADFRGFVSLEAGVSAEQRVAVASGSVEEIRDFTRDFGRQSFTGPLQQDYTLSAVRPVNGLKRLNCLLPRENTKIVIRTRMRMSNQGRAGQGMLTVDSADGRLLQTYHLAWQNCAAKEIGIGGGLLGGIVRNPNQPH